MEQTERAAKKEVYMEGQNSRKRLFITLGVVGGVVLTALVVLYVAFVAPFMHTRKYQAVS